MAPNKPLPQPSPWVILLLAVCSSAGSLALSWRHWSSPVVDFGREIYTAWQLHQGAILHRDIAWFNGPLSAWWNGFWFDRLGVGLLSLVAVNAVLFGLFLALTCWVTAQAFDRAAAAIAALVVPLVFGLSQPLGVGIFNFLTPYSHEITHGALLGIACLSATYRGRLVAWHWAPISGLALGLSALTKPEVFAATFGGWLALILALPRAHGSRTRASQVVATLASAALPLALAYLKLRTQLSPELARKALLGAWPYVADERVRELPFYANLSGLASPPAYLRAMGLALCRYTVYIACWFALRRWLGRIGSTGLFILAALCHGLFLNYVPWLSIARPLPLLALVVGFLSAWQAWRGPGPERPAPALRLGLAVFAIGLLAKIALNVRLMHYGFVLALPATVLAIGTSAVSLPQLLDSRTRLLASQIRTVVIAFWLVLSGVWLLRSNEHWNQQSGSFGSASDRFHALPELAEPMEAARTWLQQRIQSNETLLALPEGVMLNYQLRVPSPTRFVNFMPPELLFWGEHAILEELKAAPPDYVILVHKDTSEYGAPYFGRHYAQAIYAWVQRNYSIRTTFGAPPFTSPAFGVAIYSR